MARGPFEWDEDFQRLGERVDDFFDRVLLSVHVPVRKTTPQRARAGRRAD